VSTYNELREWLEAEYEYPITAQQWAGFQQDCQNALAEYDEDVADGADEDSLDRISNVFHGWWQKGRGARAETKSRDEAVTTKDPRWRAVAEILTIRARRDPDVIAVRRDMLEDQLIGLDDVPDWIEEAGEADGPPTRLVPNHDTQFPQWSSELIRYVSTYEHGFLGHRPIRIGGQLWWLRGVARRIAQGFGWPEEWAVAFILTDVPPSRPMTFGWTIHGSMVPTMGWIELRANPHAVSPRDLEAAYRRFRSGVLGLSRVDSMTEKTAALAVHWERTDGQSIADRRNEWNNLHPQWEYPTATGNFGRDARVAYAQATGEGQQS